MNENLLLDVDRYAQQQHKSDSDEQTDSASDNGSAFPPVWKVGDRIAIKPENLTPQWQYLANATGEIKAIKGSKVSVLLDEPPNKAYKRRTVNIDLCLLKLTSAQGWAQDFQQQELSPEDLSCKDYAKLTNSVVKDCAIASPKSPSTETCENSGLDKEMQTSLPVLHHVSLSQLKESGLEAQTRETVFPLSCDKSEQVNRSSLSLRTCLDCYQLLLFPETNPAHIFGRCSGNFMVVGTMRNGLLSEHPSLELSGQEKGSCLLPRPGALSWSGNGRPPGTTKSEAAAKNLGILQKNEVFNPDWLELQFGLPPGWTSPQEYRAATQLLAPAEPPSETASMCGLLKSPSQEYSTSTRSVAKKSDCWYTPLHIVQLVLEVLGEIDLDPCADDGRHIPAALHYTTTLNGLLQKWLGRVFMNPPYSCPGVWINKLQSEVESGRVREAIALVPAATDTNWLSPVLKVQPVCFWKGRIKFLDVNYQPKLPARQSHCLVYWGENWQKFKEVFEEYGVVQLPPNLTSFELLGDIKNSPSKKRGHGFGNGYIHWRTITKNGKDYPQAYYHWKENGNKRSKYIPKKLLGVIQEAEAAKRPVIEILGLLGVVVSPSKLLGEIKVNPSNLEVLGDIENSPSNHISPSNNSGDIENSPSKVDLSPSKTRRHKGEGSGSIYWRTITKSGKDYPQAYYHYEFWNQGDRLIKSTKYIPKQLLAQVQQLDATKAPVREILEVLGIIE